MNRLHQFLLPKTYQTLHHTPKHWPDSAKMHAAIHGLPDYFRALVLELLARPMSLDDMDESLRRLETQMGGRHGFSRQGAALDRDIAWAIEQGLLDTQDEKYVLTPAGREMSEHMSEVIPWFFTALFSEKAVSMMTIFVHVLLSVLKLIVGFLAQSAGLIADGIDNTADTCAAALVWLGISWKKERLTSIFIVVMMFASVAGVAMASYHKMTHPAPIEGGMAAFSVSTFCGVLMLLLSAYQYESGTRNSNFAILCQSVDSRNHVCTSLLVCLGILLSLSAERVQASWLHYADALASIAIGALILQSALELSKELRKPSDEVASVSHFLPGIRKRHREEFVLRWIAGQLQDDVLTGTELDERFSRQFCERTPKIVELTGIGYRPESPAELREYLERFVTEKKLTLTAKGYELSKRKTLK